MLLGFGSAAQVFVSGTISARVRKHLIQALRSGAVPREGLEYIAVGVDGHCQQIASDLDECRAGSSGFKIIRGAYGSGKTFLTAVISSLAMQKNFVVSKVTISSPETSLYKWMVVYRRLCENLVHRNNRDNALRLLIESWLHHLQRVLSVMDPRRCTSPPLNS